jgi:hypothetical protein
VKGQVVGYSERFAQTFDGRRVRYYLGRWRVPWIVWAMFHGGVNSVPYEERR